MQWLAIVAELSKQVLTHNLALLVIAVPSIRHSMANITVTMSIRTHHMDMVLCSNHTMALITDTVLSNIHTMAIIMAMEFNKIMDLLSALILATVLSSNLSL